MSKEPASEDPKAISLANYLAGVPAESYFNDVLVAGICGVIKMFPPSLNNLMEAIKDPREAFRAVLGHYATSRRGGDRNLLVRMYLSALDRTLGDSSFEEFLDAGDLEALWISFTEVSAELGKKQFEQQNRPVLEGISELVFEIYEEKGHGNLISWIRNEIVESHQAEHLFNRLTSIPTVGPKTASHLVRDVTALYDLEEILNYSDRHFLNPVNPIIRSIARYFLPQESNSKIPDAILAGKMCRQMRLIGVSGIKFNMGTSFLMLRPVPGINNIDELVDSLYNSSRS